MSDYNSPLTAASQQDQPAQESDAITIDLLGLLSMLWRRKFLIVLFVAAGFCLSFFAAQSIAPSYTARSLLLLTSQKSAASVALSGVLGGNKFDNSFIVGEVEIMRSRMMGRLLVERLGLYRGSGLMEASEGQVPSSSAVGFKTLSIEGYDSDMNPATSNPALEQVVSAFLRSLSVRAIPGSSAIQVEFSAGSAVQAASVSNAVVDLYIAQKLEDRFRTLRRVNSWMDSRITELQQGVVDAEKALHDYKVEHTILEGRRSLVSAEQLTNFNAKLIAAQTKATELRIKLDQVRTLQQDDDSGHMVLQILATPSVRKLKQDELELGRHVLDLEARYGPKHPRIIQARSELLEIERSLGEEAQSAVQSIENELALADANVGALEEEFGKSSDQSLSDTTMLIRLRALEREAEAAHVIYNKMLENYKRADRERELQGPDARVISYAVPPAVPTSPNKPLIVSLGTFLSLCFGVLLAIILGKLDQSIRSASQLERLLRIPCFGLVPSVPKVEGPDLSRYVVKYPGSMVAESVRTLRTVVNLRTTPDPAKVISITSSFSGEGKTVMSTWIARATAKAGERVIVIDCDLRRPNIHKTIGEDNPVSLVEYLTGEAELEDIIQKDPLSGMHMIYARAVPHNALYLVGSDRMRNLVEALRRTYDLVILDTPACLAVSDARVLATLSDITLYGVSWGETPRDAVKYGVQQFLDINVPLATVLMNVDVARQVQYGYAESVYYQED